MLPRMNRDELDADLPILTVHLHQVLRKLEAKRTKAPRKVSRVALILTFLRTGECQCDCADPARLAVTGAADAGARDLHGEAHGRTVATAGRRGLRR
jgi:hypothetical protein